MRDRRADLVRLHHRFGRDAAVGLADPWVCLRAISVSGWPNRSGAGDVVGASVEGSVKEFANPPTQFVSEARGLLKYRFYR